MPDQWDGLHTLYVDDGLTTINCAATEGADCRSACGQRGCEDGCAAPMTHPRVDQGECIIALWITESGVEDSATKAEFPISVRWEGSGYTWTNLSPGERMST